MHAVGSVPYKVIQLAHIGSHLIPQADQFLIQQKSAIRYRDAYYLKFPTGEAWLMEYGILVSWNLTIDEHQLLSKELKDWFLDAGVEQVSERYSYVISDKYDFSIRHDVITLKTDETLVRLALSHAFAQSTKLQVFEARAQKVISDNRSITKDLATKGSIKLSRKKLAKLRGLLFDTGSDISLHFNLLDTPEFFWDYPEMESYYLALMKYLDLKPRIDILNHKLATIRELLDMLASEQHHKHAAWLEWIIIILIAVDIAVYFTPK
mgnify:CR=1 FL=1|tara:strand:+ start:720 stop:1514 length:795 start_codon:yes stop_codon:yes gene_type:complete